MHPIHVLFGTESNNCADLADRTGSALTAAGMSASVIDMGDFANAKLGEVRTLIVITSTYGNGDPPSNAESLHAYVMKSAPSLPHLRFAVCALGDKTYDRFCQCGKDFDRRLEELGGTRIVERKDCDVDYEKPWKAWLDHLVPALRALAESDATTTAPVIPIEGPKVEHHEAKPGTRRNPVMAKVLEKRRLSSGASTKETIHVAFGLSGTGLSYEVGDSLGVWPTNDPRLVAEILDAASCDGDAKVTLRGAVHESSRGTGTITLREALSTHVDISHVDTRLLEACGSRPIEGGHALDVLLASEKPITPQTLVESLRPLAPRQYSIASSLRAHPEEAHFTIDVVRYELLGRRRGGVASTHFVDRASIGSEIPVYLHPAPHFRLAADDLPIIMIGPGTGIAPFRAFIEERAVRGAKGRSWLFFGARNAAHDFLYGDELRAYRDRGVLTRLDCAFSRDQDSRLYVQHRMEENARELYAWIEDGAVIYVCGDAKRMAPDVHHALASIMSREGSVSTDAGLARLAQMETENRYLRDIY
jgi:sulfite reductase (NADPH) flavoprotein alpha-component